MKFEHLEIFSAVYRAGGFAAVASEHNVAPSSISRAIASLETSLQVRLFQRTTRKLTPTQAGELFFRRLEPLIEEFHVVRDEIADKPKNPSGRLRVTASVSYGQIVIAPRLKKFRRLHPNIELELILSDNYVDIIERRIDIAIRHGVLMDSALIARKITDVRYRLVASPDYLKTAPSVRKPSDIENHPVVRFSYDRFRSVWKFRKNNVVKSVTTKPSITVTNAAVILQCALDGHGLALLSDWMVKKEIQSGKLIEVLPDWDAAGASFDSAIWLVFPSRKFLPARTRAFADFISQPFIKEP
jgi:DNA-binding transcriptional LysR family regulator